MKLNEPANHESIQSLRTHFSSSDELCEYMCDLSGGNTLLAFSTGKDSIVCWLKLRRYFKNIVPYYLYCVPGGPLSFTETALQYYEDFFGTRIIRLPHPAMYYFWNNAVFQAPENLRILENANLYDFTYEDINELVRHTGENLEMAYQATGVRSADSIVRRQAMLRYGQVNHNQKRYYPVYDYKKEDMVRELDEANIALPIDYEWFGRSFDGIDYRFTSIIKEKSPEDYDRICAAYPMVELDILRQQYRREFYEGAI